MLLKMKKQYFSTNYQNVHIEKFISLRICKLFFFYKMYKVKTFNYFQSAKTEILLWPTSFDIK